MKEKISLLQCGSLALFKRGVRGASAGFAGFSAQFLDSLFLSTNTEVILFNSSTL